MGHTLFDIFGGIPPLDFADQSGFLLQALAWAVSTACVAILLKRWVWRPLLHDECAGLWRYVLLDLGVLVLVLITVLGLDLQSRLRLGDPGAITAKVTRVLDSPDSTLAERESALSDMERFLGKFKPTDVSKAVALLRREIRVQPEPINLAVAEVLLRFHDMSGLPLIEDALMHESDPAWPPPGGWESLASHLAMSRDTTALPALVQLMGSSDASTRLAAAEGIRDLDSPAAIEPLAKGLDDPDVQIQSICCYGLLRILDHHRSQYHWEIPLFDQSLDAQQRYQVRLAALRTWAKEWQSGAK